MFRTGMLVLMLLSLIVFAIGCSDYKLETQHTIQGLIRDEWLLDANNNNDNDNDNALINWGLPLAEATDIVGEDGRAYLTQPFEKGWIEFHPENEHPYDVLITRLGAALYARSYPLGAPGQRRNGVNSLYFAATGKAIGGSFRTFWEAHGSMRRFGLPLSDEFVETSAVDGKPYTVQYFERAVMEYHPEHRATLHEVQLVHVGVLEVARRFPLGAEQLPALGPVPAGSPSPITSAIDRDGDGVTLEDDDCGNSAESYNDIMDSDGCPDSLQDLITALEYGTGAYISLDEPSLGLDGFWRKQFADWGLAYSTPKGGIQAYTTPQYVEGCGIVLQENNAYFCPGLETIFYHRPFLEHQWHDRDLGPYAPMEIISHEWGHFVAYKLNTPTRPSIRNELAADCYSGAYAKYAQDVPMSAYVARPDLGAAVLQLYRIGDPLDYPWFHPSAHGQPEERVRAFLLGYDRGATACRTQVFHPTP